MIYESITESLLRLQIERLTSLSTEAECGHRPRSPKRHLGF